MADDGFRILQQFGCDFASRGQYGRGLGNDLEVVCAHRTELIVVLHTYSLGLAPAVLTTSAATDWSAEQ
ncbi:hypothetical protein CAL26_01280 [Bordetella genomosp. 9]|uniref:Uncharacterized protein n=3 Tax=Bordetella TaxID=517 RepID=A0A261RML5_9BORD|nr:hypothetical protein BAU08_19585 [Bordetella bronchialis]ARP82939.1 hypothetical protein CAL12_20385 [Bordetella genomosp. 8]OZI26017.1 hypothetical protein CAL26_01280 [Bordetella genomosp. 9]